MSLALALVAILVLAGAGFLGRDRIREFVTWLRWGDDALVLSVLVEDFLSDESIKPTSSDIATRTAEPQWLLISEQLEADIEHCGREVPRDLVQSIRERNAERVALEFLPVGRADSERAAQLHLPGFNERRDLALARLTFSWGRHSGTLTCLLRKSGGRWVVEWRCIAYYM